MRKTIVIGLDGANWDLVAPWIENGDLPNLKYLMDNGCWSDSISQFPTVTCPNWKCYSTGKNPGKLGVFWWMRLDREKKKLIGYDSQSFKSLEIFDYISDAGFRVGVLNMPTTYPPKALNGFMVAGPPDSSLTGYTYPKSLEKDLKTNYNYSVYPSIHIASREDIENYFEEILNIMDLRFKVAKDLLDTVDFLHMSIFYINVLHHFFYDEEPVKEGWKLIDRNLGDFLEMDVNILLMSDHGTHEIDTVFYVNSWLEKEGYLKLKKSYIRNLYKIGITKQRLVSVANKLKVTNLIKSVVPEKIIRSVPSEEGTLGGRVAILEDKIDWDKSKVLGAGQGTIFMISDEKGKEYERIRNEVIEKLGKLSTPNGRYVA
ncbi:MAG: alkaline phosphatase family protein, partial [Halobacteriota archaeon]